MHKRLHLGAVSAERLSRPHLAPLVDSSWIHLGDRCAPSRLAAAVLRKTHFQPFYYRRGDRLPFDDETFSFIFSEHFLEHLFLDEACELLKECRRVLGRGGCLRTVVPDADLRTYELPEPPGYSTGGPSWTDPGKHKSRWSIYSLAYVLGECGFRTRGVVYCDKYGDYHCRLPDPGEACYGGCLEPDLIRDVSYISRFENSLIVDALR